MHSDGQEALRIALGFSGAFVIAEASEVQLTFIAPLAAGTLLVAGAPRLALLVALPIIAWLIPFFAGFALQAFHGLPIILCLLMLGVFTAAFRLSSKRSTAAIGLIALVFCAVIPDVLIRAPELGEDVARWISGNFAAASVAVFLANLIIPPRPRDRPVRDFLPPPLSPGVAAAVLLVAVILTVTFQPPAPGATLVGVVLALRPDTIEPAQVIRNRLIAALVGGAAAAVAWQAIWLAPGLHVFAAATLGLSWLIALRIVANGPDAAAAMKTLNAFAILLGQGFSILYDDTDDRLWERIAGVIIGVSFAAVALALLRPTSTRERDGLVATPIPGPAERPKTLNN